MANDVGHGWAVKAPLRKPVKMSGAGEWRQLEKLDSGIDVGEWYEGITSITISGLARQSDAREHAFGTQRAST